MGVNLSNYQPIILDDFNAPTGNPAGFSLRNGDSGAGIWSSKLNDTSFINVDGATTLFSNPFLKDADGNSLGINPFSVQNGILSIQSGAIAPGKMDAVRSIATDKELPGIKNGSTYSSGLINLNDTWSETYGYTEVRARMPEGIGHLVSAWMINTTKGSTPEIDMFEILGRQNGGPDSFNRRDNEVNANVIYDIIGAGPDYGKPVHKLDKVNNLGLDANGKPIYDPVTPFDYTVDAQERFGNRYVFKNTIDAKADYGLNIFDEFVTFGTEWTPEKITFYIGRDSNNMVKFFETETPADVNTNTSFLLWDRIGGTYAGNPNAQSLQDKLEVDYVKIYARKPGSEIVGDPNATYIYGTSAAERVVGNAKANIIFGGMGPDNVVGGGGADKFYLVNGLGNLIIEDFSSAQGDKVVLEGLIVGTAQDAYETLTQVGNDVLLITGRAGIDNAQTVVFRNMRVSDFAPSDFIIAAPEGRPASYLDEKQKLVGQDFYGSDSRNDYLQGRAIPIGGTVSVDAARIFGGKGDDTYFLDAGSAVVEQVNEGVDGVLLVTPQFEDRYVLPDNVEIATLLKDTLTYDLIGNGLGNRLIGNDQGTVFDGKGGNDFIRLGAGRDTVIHTVGEGSDVIVGFGADDVLKINNTDFANFQEFKDAVVVNGPDFVIALPGEDSIILRYTKFAEITEANFDIEYGGGGTPPPSGGMDGGPGSDVIVGTAAADLVRGFNGVDILRGEGGDDLVLGGEGDDLLLGGAGADFLRGGGGDDSLDGGIGDDTLNGELGDDALRGGEGAERISGGAGDDTLFGDSGDDVLNGDEGDDTFAGGTGNDQVRGGTGTDVAVYEGRIAGYDFERISATSIRVTDTAGDDGSDVMFDIDAFVFGGVRVSAADLPF